MRRAATVAGSRRLAGARGMDAGAVFSDAACRKLRKLRERQKKATLRIAELTTARKAIDEKMAELDGERDGRKADQLHADWSRCEHALSMERSELKEIAELMGTTIDQAGQGELDFEPGDNGAPPKKKEKQPLFDGKTRDTPEAADEPDEK